MREWGWGQAVRAGSVSAFRGGRVRRGYVSGAVVRLATRSSVGNVDVCHRSEVDCGDQWLVRSAEDGRMLFEGKNASWNVM